MQLFRGHVAGAQAAAAAKSSAETIAWFSSIQLSFRIDGSLEISSITFIESGLGASASAFSYKVFVNIKVQIS